MIDDELRTRFDILGGPGARANVGCRTLSYRTTRRPHPSPAPRLVVVAACVAVAVGCCPARILRTRRSRALSHQPTPRRLVTSPATAQLTSSQRRPGSRSQQLYGGSGHRCESLRAGTGQALRGVEPRAAAPAQVQCRLLPGRRRPRRADPAPVHRGSALCMHYAMVALGTVPRLARQRRSSTSADCSLLAERCPAATARTVAVPPLAVLRRQACRLGRPTVRRSRRAGRARRAYSHGR